MGDNAALWDSAIKKLPFRLTDYSDILAIFSNPDSSASDLEHAIKEDPLIAAKVLRMANSAYFGITSQVISLHNAVVLLGFEKIKALFLLSTLSGFSGISPRYDLHSYYVHSAAVAVAASTVARHLQQKMRIDPEEIFSIALLHDIGIPLIVSIEPGELDAACARAIEDNIPYHLSEKAPWKHTEAGEFLAKAWHFPERLIQVIAHHHFDKSVVMGIECAIVHVADSMMQFFGYGITTGLPNQTVNDEALEILGISAEQLKVIAEKSLMEQQKIVSFAQTIL